MICMSADSTYDEIKLIPESGRDGWCLGYVGVPWPGPWPKRTGDLFIRDPAGGHAGLAWESEGPDILKITGASRGRWGVYQVRFPFIVMSERDLIRNFHAVLPLLKKARTEVGARCD